MARSAFESVIQVQVAKYGPDAAKRHHIAVARRGLADYLARQDARPDYSIETDGRPAASELSVQPYGIITYRFRRMREVAAFALAEAIRLSPHRSGRYKRSWFAMVDGAEVDVDAIRQDAGLVLITNDQPYSRKINVGAKGFEKYANPGIVERVRQLVRRRYGTIVAPEIEYLTLEGAYRLKRDLFRRNKRGERYGSARRDALAGSDLRYPAIALKSKF
ncbi:hypothetical protein STAQ_27680 [Allostella sp. ATCC 35155]|nr:hypothetical protein STAQ_27680 [Stella sp. ATCC 35155]